MPAKRRTSSQRTGESTPQPDVTQVLAVYHVDLMAEVEGLLRTLTRTQQQIERLRSGGVEGVLTPSQRREAIKLLLGNLKALAVKVDTLRDTIPEVIKTAGQLEDAEEADESESDRSPE